jgi:hypothetical protein
VVGMIPGEERSKGELTGSLIGVGHGSPFI